MNGNLDLLLELLRQRQQPQQNAPLAIFDPRTQMGGHEMNILGRYRYQDL